MHNLALAAFCKSLKINPKQKQSEKEMKHQRFELLFVVVVGYPTLFEGGGLAGDHGALEAGKQSEVVERQRTAKE